jgi:hypothetical protein
MPTIPASGLNSLNSHLPHKKVNSVAGKRNRWLVQRTAGCSTSLPRIFHWKSGGSEECAVLSTKSRAGGIAPKDGERRLLRRNDSSRTVACRQGHSPVIPFRLLGGAGAGGPIWDVFADDGPPSALRAQGLRVFGGEPGGAAGALQVGD